MKLIKRIAVFIFVFLLLVSFSAAADGRTVTDMAGREVEIPEKVNRVVSSYIPATQFVFALGAGDRLVAIDVGSPRMDFPLFSQLRPDYKELPVVGGRKSGLNLEEIIAVDPDLVILFPYNDGPDTAARLEQQGIASVIIKPESYQQIRETNLLLGKALNLEEKAAEIDAWFEEILTAVKGTEDNKGTADDPEKVYFANSDLLNTVGRGMMQTSLIELAGGVNPAAGLKAGFIETSPEQLFAWDPDVVVVSRFFSPTVEKLLAKQRYQSVTAFKNEEIYRFPSSLEPWDFPSPAAYLGILWLHHKLYPERLPEEKMREITDDFYQTLYGKTFTDLGGKLQAGIE